MLLIHADEGLACMLATSLASSRPEKPSAAFAASCMSSGVMPFAWMASGRPERPLSSARILPKMPVSACAPAPPVMAEKVSVPA